MRKMAGVLVALMVLGLVAQAFAGDTQEKYKDLERLSSIDRKITLKWKGGDLRKLFRMVDGVAAITITYGDGFPAEKKVSYELEVGTVRQALVTLAEEHSLTYEVTGPDSMTVKGAQPKP